MKIITRIGSFFSLVVILAIGSLTYGQTQPTVLQLGERLPYLYYWGKYSFDSAYLKSGCTYYLTGPFSYLTGPSGYNYFVGRACITSAPLKVIGIAGAARIETAVASLTLDTVLAHRVPEYFRLYQKEGDSLYFMKEVRWDTITPNYKMLYPLDGLSDITFNLYEAYFDKPVIVHDVFIVGGTQQNNLFHGRDEELWPNNPNRGLQYSERIPTVYPLADQLGANPCNSNTYFPWPGYYVVRYFWPYRFLYPGSSELALFPSYDTTHFYEITPSINTGYDRSWLPFFAIFDTNFVYDACMGVATTGLYVEEVDTSGSVTLAWDDSGVEQWQVSVARLGVEADSGMLFASPINYLQVAELDTGSWYVARVRTLCDTDFFGAWSDSVLFYMPGRSCMTPTGLHVVAVDSAMVSLAWDAGMASTWQVERGMCDLGMNNTQTVTTQAPALTVADLPFGNAWYWARVRVVCDTDFWSDWTDTVHFYVPNQHTGGGPDDTTQAINLVEHYTYLIPNPARDEVTVASSFHVKAVELYAADGKLLQQVEVNTVGMTLSLEGLPAGIYFVRVHTSAGVTTKRLVVE